MSCSMNIFIADFRREKTTDKFKLITRIKPFFDFLIILAIFIGVKEGSASALPKPGNPKPSSSLTLNLVENSSFILIQFYPKEETLDMTVRVDLELYKSWYASADSGKNSTSNNTSNKSPQNSSSATVQNKVKGSSSASSSETEKSKSDQVPNADESSENMESGSATATVKKINIGFDFGGKFVDVISISLLPFEENGDLAADQSIIHMESPGDGILLGSDHVQDFHWNKRDGVLVPDLTQNYELVTFDVEKNGSLISTSISRPWLTCDGHDVQFSLEPIEVWWNLETSDSPSILKQMLSQTNNPASSNPIMFENLENEDEEEGSGTTLIPDTEDQEPGQVINDGGNSKNKTDKNDKAEETTETIRTTTTASSTVVKNITLIESSGNSNSSNSSSASDKGKNNPKEESPPMDQKEIEVLKSIKDHDFQGPVILSMEKLLVNFTTVFIKGCSNNPSSPTKALALNARNKSQKSKSQPPLIFNCSLADYSAKKGEMKESPLKIYGLAKTTTMTRQVRPSSSSVGVRKSQSSSSFVEIEAERCPASLLLQNMDDMEQTFYHALTGGDEHSHRRKGSPRQAKNNNEGGGRESGGRNSAASTNTVTSFSSQLVFLPLSTFLLLLYNFPCHSPYQAVTFIL